MSKSDPTGHPGVDRRHFLRSAGLAGLGCAFGGHGLAWAGDKPIPFLPDGPPRPLCSNIPFGDPIRAETPQLEFKAAYDYAKLWPIGDKIRVQFLNGKGDPWVEYVQKRVREIAPTWSRYANLTFQFFEQNETPDRVDLSVNFYPFYDSAGRYYNYGLFNCYLGTDTRAVIQQNLWSMNLLFNPNMQAYLTTNKPWLESEFHRLILHEFGHGTGLIHEHQRPDAPIYWTPALYTYAKNNWGWEKQTVDEQIIARYKPVGGLVGTVYDVRSIMEYEYPKGVAYYTKNGQPDYTQPFEAPNNVQLTALDKVAASVTYPMPINPLAEVKLTVGAAAVAGKIQKAGQVARYSFRTGAAGKYTIRTQGKVLLAALQQSNPRWLDFNNTSPTFAQGGRGRPSNILGATEAGDNGTASLIGTLPANTDYFVEVRDLTPTAAPAGGETAFTISVGPTS